MKSVGLLLVSWTHYSKIAHVTELHKDTSENTYKIPPEAAPQYCPLFASQRQEGAYAQIHQPSLCRRCQESRVLINSVAIEINIL